MPIKNHEKLLFLMEKNTGFLRFFIFKKLNFYKSLKLKTAERWFFLILQNVLRPLSLF